MTEVPSEPAGLPAGDGDAREAAEIIAANLPSWMPAAEPLVVSLLAEMTPRQQRELPQWVHGFHSEVPLGIRRQVGRLFLRWKASRPRCSSGRLAKGSMADFAAEHKLGRCTRKLERWIHGCERLVHREAAAPETEQLMCGDSHRKRRSGRQGRPFLAPVLREELFAWFVDLRFRVKGRIFLSTLINRAKVLREHELARARQSGEPGCRLPKITSRWVKSWRSEYGVSLRLPNKRFKVSKQVYAERCKIMFTNVIKVRALCVAAFGYDPIIEGFDQQPLHFNESGSKCRKTLAFRGQDQVAVEESVDASRARFTAMTFVSSDPHRFPNGLPLEICYKGGAVIRKEVVDAAAAVRGGEGRVAGPCVGEGRVAGPRVGEGRVAGPPLTATTSESGSYNTDLVLEYMARVLDPMVPGRRWRILMLDAYKPHLSQRISDLAWSRGYVVVMHGGGCTGATQVNDTHGHEPFSKDISVERGGGWGPDGHEPLSLRVLCVGWVVGG